MEQQVRRPQAQQPLQNQRRTDRELHDAKSNHNEPVQLDDEMLKHVSGGVAAGPHNNW